MDNNDHMLKVAKEWIESVLISQNSGDNSSKNSQLT